MISFNRLIPFLLMIGLVQGCGKPKANPRSPLTVQSIPQVTSRPPISTGLQATSSVKPTSMGWTLGDTWTRPNDSGVMVFVPGGEFEMGNTNDQLRFSVQLCEEDDSRIFGEDARCFASEFADETPAHMVILDAFWIDRTEVTNEQYRHCVEAGVCSPPTEYSSYTRATYYDDAAYEGYPVIWVGWEQATEYCNWVGARLPTEAEWEYAARGPESKMFPWGNTFDGARLNYCDANCPLGTADAGADDGYPDTAPVGNYPSGKSWCGALDMAGNVREWVSDWYGSYQRGQQANPRGPLSGQLLVSRGGSWFDSLSNVRSTKRGQNAPDFSAYKLGIRCVKD